MLYILIILAVGICLYVSLAPKLPGMQEGRWEITMASEIPGSRKPVTVTNTQTLNKESPVPEITLPGFECRLRRMRYPYHVVGNFVLYRLKCQGTGNSRDKRPGAVLGTGHLKYRGNTLKGKIKMSSIDDQENKKVIVRITGKYQSVA